jgi:hypothetical protein
MYSCMFDACMLWLLFYFNTFNYFLQKRLNNYQNAGKHTNDSRVEFFELATTRGSQWGHQVTTRYT